MKTKKEKKGAGKPAFFSKPMKRVNVMLDEDTVKFYTEHGKGNLSEGIRKHWRGLTSLALDGACESCKLELTPSCPIRTGNGCDLYQPRQ